jgi:cytochrome c-type biogenesis protein CcmH
MLLRDLLFALSLTCVAVVASAGEVDPLAAEPALEARVHEVAEVLRCLVCQSQTIAESHGGLAIDLKNEIRGRLRAGASVDQVTDFMVARYGDFVLYRPPVKQTTWLLWFGPFVLLAGGLGVLFVKLHGRRIVPAELSGGELARAHALLPGEPEEAREAS